MRGNWFGNWFGTWFNPAGAGVATAIDGTRQRPAWRLRIRAPRREDASELTLLSVAEGGPAGVDRACFATRGPLRPNLLDNPEAAASLNGWGTNLATISRQTSGDLMGWGARVECLTTNAANAGCYVRRGSGAMVPAAPGDVTGFSLHVEGSTAVGKQVHLVAHWWDGSSFISTPAGPTVTLVTGWQRLSMLATAPVGTIGCLLAVYTVGAQGAFTFSVSAAQIEEVVPVGVLAEGEGRVGLYNHTDAGYYPLLGIPSGRRNTIDFLGRKLRSGNIALRILDARIAGANAERILSAFLGTMFGEPQLLGCKAEVDFTEDAEPSSGAVKWARWFTGRVDDVELDGKIAYVLNVSDMARELRAPLFSTGPHASIDYAVPQQLWPLGHAKPYGNLPADGLIEGAIVEAPTGGGRAWAVKLAEQANKHAGVTEALFGSDVPSVRGGTVIGGTGTPAGMPAGQILYSQTVVARLTTMAGALIGDYEVGGYLYTHGGWGAAFKPVSVVYIRAMEGGPGVPANGTPCALQVLPSRLPPSKEAPLLLNDQHPIQLIVDALEGRLGPINNDGSIRRTYAYDSVSTAALLAQPRGPARCLIDRETSIDEFIEGLCRQFNYGYRLDEYGRVVVFDLALPTALSGVPSLTVADLLGSAEAGWTASRDNAITQFNIQWYLDVPIDVDSLSRGEGSLVQAPSQALLKSYPRPLSLHDFGRLDLGDRSVSLDAWAIRTGENEVYQGMNRELWQRGQVIDLLEYFRTPFSSGPMETTIRTRRTAVATALREGMLVLLNVSWLPNPANSRRGGTRLARILDRNDDANALRFRVLDMGPSVNLAPPTLGALAADTTNPYNGITLPIVLNGAGDPARVELAVTDASVTTVEGVPANAWRSAGVAIANDTMRTLSLPSGRRIWARGRTERSKGSGILKLPSAWSYTTAPGYLDLAPLAQITGLTRGTTSTLGALLTWDPPAAGCFVEVWLAIPSSDPMERVVLLPPGTEEYQISGTSAGNTCAAAVRVYDGVGGYGPFSTTVSWTAAGAAPVAPIPRALIVADFGAYGIP